MHQPLMRPQFSNCMSLVLLLSDSDSEDEIPSSPSSLTSSLPSTANHLMDTATCFPPIFDSASDNPPVRDKQRFYNVYSGDQCGCFRDWSDASGRVLGVKGNRHKAYDTWEEALDGWRQNCHGYHCHPANFEDGTLFRPDTTANIPEATVPPPSQHNVVFLSASDPKASPTGPPRPSTPRRDPARASLDVARLLQKITISVNQLRASSPASPSKRSSRASTSYSRTTPRHWAVSSADFNGVVSTSQASRLFNEAVVDMREVDMCKISSFDEALDWFSRLNLASRDIQT
ncbi:hypothetical protein BT96DRAFT_1007931 [Gymnopus androsaceus JB14]|uniref:Ribonuclease H1 N-terminal domain-containing protein n=1 Tax=Gymnopus androsaceus JB14 TaxID=1447944 RepID=A0A6A4GG74_9AGAR|nr:hypothetical protein BT96DRAFT_1007931 [Gymnopus androsaceus JB14]